MKVINTAIISNPANWVKVPLMALTAFVGLFLVLSFLNPNTEEA